MECGSKQKLARESKGEAKGHTASHWWNLNTASSSMAKLERETYYAK